MTTLDEVKELISKELKPILSKVDDLQKKFSSLEKSVDFMSKKYNSLLNEFQKTKGEVLNHDKDLTMIKQDIKIIDKRACEALNEVDDLAQYIRRDCLEISGVKAKDEAYAESVVEAIGSHIGSPVTKADISIAHPLPSSRNAKAPPKLIVKFTSRKVRNHFYANRKKLAKTKAQDIPSLNLRSTSMIFISESLTPKRRRLFGEVNKIKKQRKWKYIWTTNGKIFLKEKDQSSTYTFEREEDLYNFDMNYDGYD